MARVALCALAVTTTVALGACASGGRAFVKAPAAANDRLWEEPADLASRDLYYGPWGRDLAPDPRGTYTFVDRKHTGINPGLTVRDEQGREWSVKQAHPDGVDFEGPVEVAVSRLLSGIGYYQPAVYFLPSFWLKDDWGTHAEPGGRFRLKQPTLKETDTWSWHENPFVGTMPYQGLLTLLMMFNSTDLKDANTSLYERRSDLVERWYVVRDLGAALGDTRVMAPRKGDPDAFERTPFILGVSNGHVDFAYTGLYKKLVVGRITPDEVAWASKLLGRLSDRQFHDAFRAGGYTPEVSGRFVRELRKRIGQGEALGKRAN